MNKNEKIRESVSTAYAQVVSEGSSCCGPTCCEPKNAGTSDKNSAKAGKKGGSLTSLAGYSSAELGSVPEDASSNFFGCGNPLSFSDVKAGQTVLDLGSGAGMDLLIAGQKVGAAGRVIGIDMTDAMIEKARANVKKAQAENVEIRKGIIEELPVESNSVDWVISNCVINLSPEKDRVFSEIERVLKPGGQMLVSDVVVQDIPKWMLKGAALYHSCVGGSIGEQEYIAGLQKAGLRNVEVKARLVYDKTQIKGLIKTENIPGLNRIPGNRLGGMVITPLVRYVSGKVWSAKFYAQKAG